MQIPVNGSRQRGPLPMSPVESGVDMPDELTTRTNSSVAIVPQISNIDATADSTMSVWYRPKLSRDEAIRILRQQTPGSFLVRDSTSYQNAYGLAVKVSQLPPKVQPKSGRQDLTSSSYACPGSICAYCACYHERCSRDTAFIPLSDISDDMQSELVRHYLIEAASDGRESGVRLKGFTNEPIFPTLAELIQEHTHNQLALPCRLVLPGSSVLITESRHAASLHSNGVHAHQTDASS
ncbi:Tensin 1 [Cichlidogyrus casuarinus]|uniref:Tensin 1 n=1 Tax=Cichlidogyrus casuarinus TaxID=1844966 RepID=A0ABD2PRS1_9PLAT